MNKGPSGSTGSHAHAIKRSLNSGGSWSGVGRRAKPYKEPKPKKKLKTKREPVFVSFTYKIPL